MLEGVGQDRQSDVRGSQGDRELASGFLGRIDSARRGSLFESSKVATDARDVAVDPLGDVFHADVAVKAGESTRDEAAGAPLVPDGQDEASHRRDLRKFGPKRLLAVDDALGQLGLGSSVEHGRVSNVLEVEIDRLTRRSVFGVPGFSLMFPDRHRLLPLSGGVRPGVSGLSLPFRPCLLSGFA